MQFRTRVAVIILRDNRLLLVKMVDPDTGFTWWIPPGGRLEESDSSILECAKREVFEETGVTVEVSKVRYVAEFVDHDSDTHYLELFLIADNSSGEFSMKNIPDNELELDYIKEIAWINRSEVSKMRIFPEPLRNEFWADLDNGRQSTEYLGRRSTSERTA